MRYNIQPGAQIEIIFKDGKKHIEDLFELYQNSPGDFDISDEGSFFDAEGELVGDDSYDDTDTYHSHYIISFSVYIPTQDGDGEKRYDIELTQDDQSEFGFECSCINDDEIKSIRYYEE